MQVEDYDVERDMIKAGYFMNKELDQIWDKNRDLQVSAFIDEIIACSRGFKDAIGQVVGQIQDDEEREEYANYYLIWSMVQIFYFERSNSKGQDFIYLMKNFYDESDDLDNILISGDFNGFITKLKEIKIDMDFSGMDKQKVLELFKEIEEFISNRKNYLTKLQIHANFITQKQAFKQLFEEQINKAKGLLKKLQLIVPSNKEEFVPLINSLKLLCSDIDFVRENFLDNAQKLINIFVLFFDPLIEENSYKEFLNELIGCNIDNLNDSPEDSNSKKQIKKLFEGNNCAYVSAILRNPDDPVDFFKIIVNSLPKWLTFHFYKLLIILDIVKDNISDESTQASVFRLQCHDYLNYLINKQVDFNLFCDYYYLFYDLENRINFEFLLKIVVININDQDMYKVLEKNKCEYIVDKALMEVLSFEDTQYLNIRTLLSLLLYSSIAVVPSRLYKIILNTKINQGIEASSVQRENELQEMLQLIELTISESNIEPSKLIPLIDVIKAKIVIIKERDVNVKYIASLMRNLDKQVKYDLIISLELMDCIIKAFELVEREKKVVFDDFDLINGFLTNLHLIRVKNEILNEERRYGCIIERAEQIASTLLHEV